MKTRTSTKISATWIPIFSVFSFIIGMLVTSRSLPFPLFSDILTFQILYFFICEVGNLGLWVLIWKEFKTLFLVRSWKFFFGVQDVGPTRIKRVASCAASAGPTTTTSDLRGLCYQEGNMFCLIFLILFFHKGFQIVFLLCFFFLKKISLFFLHQMLPKDAVSELQKTHEAIQWVPHRIYFFVFYAWESKTVWRDL